MWDMGSSFNRGKKQEFFIGEYVDNDGDEQWKR
jgi:hypothetical protein